MADPTERQGAHQAELEGRIHDLEQQLQRLHALSARSDSRFRAVLDSAPDAAICVGADGVIVWANVRAGEFFGYERDELIGRSLEILLPERLRAVHEVHRASFVHDPRPRPMGTGLELFGRRKDGSEFPVDVSLSAIDDPEQPLYLALVRDVTARKQADEDARRLSEHELLRQQALEINDVVVQGLATASYALDAGETATAGEALRATIASARNLMGDLLGGDSDFRPGELLRGRPAKVLPTPAPPAEPQPPVAPVGRPRIVIADDTPDIRLVMRSALRHAFDVVAEAGDGREAIDAVERERPDAILLDLAMPVMDGLQAIPEIKRVSPGTKIVVLSGYGRDQMGDEAIMAGAEAYLEKGRPLDYIAETLHEICGSDPPEEHAGVPSATPPAAENPFAGTSALLAQLAHPLTVVSQMVTTLKQRIDVLPSAAVGELLDAVARNVDHITSSVDAFDDARKISDGALAVAADDVELGILVRQIVAENASMVGGRAVSVVGDHTTPARADVLRVRQVVVELLENAVKFSPSGSIITIDVRPDGGQATVAVTNAGGPIPVEQRKGIFDRFTRLDPDAPGLGLGLYVARGIARAHGGDLVLERSDASGTTFALRLPAASAVPSA